MEEHRTFCRICPVLCGVVVRRDGERVVDVRGDRDHPVTKGYTCPKGRALGAFHHHPRRLDHPRLRGRVVSWPEMTTALARELRSIVDQHGADAVGAYFGTWSWMDALGRQRADQLLRHIGSRSRYSATTVDAIARLVVAELMTGMASLMPMIDTADPGLTILVGTNPVVSHGHAGALVDPVVTLRRIARDHGLWVVDPRRTETARLATVHLPIRPGSDPALLAFVTNGLLADGADTDYLARHADGVDDLRRSVAGWDAARAAARTGLDPAQLQQLLDAVRAAGRVTVITGTGCTMAAEANVTEWLAWAAQIVTGSFERDGGAWFNPGAFARHDRVGHPRTGGPRPGPASRPDLPSHLGEQPCAALADEIEAGNLRALLVIGGNAVTALPDTNRLRRALARLEVLAVADVIECETVDLATHVLPVAGQLERDDVSWFTDRFPPVISAQRTDAVVAPIADRRPLFDVLQDVGEQLGLARDPDPMARYVRRIPELASAGVYVGDPPRVKGWVHDRVLEDGRWRVAPAPLVEQFAAWEGGPTVRLVAIPRRSLRRMNSVLRDVGRGIEDSEVWLHPSDASTYGVTDAVVVSTPAGSIRARARITDEIVAGAVSIPHGLQEANVSELTRTTPDATDRLSGMVTQSGFAVEIAPPNAGASA